VPVACLPDRSALDTPPVAFICDTRADRPAAAATAASAADWEIGGAAARPGGGVGSFLREASRLSSASARESKTSGCILRSLEVRSLNALQPRKMVLFHASLLSWRELTTGGCLQHFHSAAASFGVCRRRGHRFRHSDFVHHTRCHRHDERQSNPKGCGRGFHNRRPMVCHMSKHSKCNIFAFITYVFGNLYAYQKKKSTNSRRRRRFFSDVMRQRCHRPCVPLAAALLALIELQALEYLKGAAALQHVFVLFSRAGNCSCDTHCACRLRQPTASTRHHVTPDVPSSAWWHLLCSLFSFPQRAR